MHADLVFTGGPVLSPHNGWAPAGALAVAGGRILAVGSNSDVMHTTGPGTRVINLQGRPLLPGLIDAHIHLLGYALTLDRLALAGLPSLEAVKAAVAGAAARRPPGEFVYGRGWDQDRWAERREPNRHDLDQVSPTHPVLLLRNCHHVGVANSAALRAAGITRETPDPDGGRIDRDPATGEPTGMLRENALGLVTRAMPEVPHERRRVLLEQAIGEALSYGITQVHTDDVHHAGGLDEAADLFTSLIGPAGLPLRTTQMIPMALLEEANRRGIKTTAGHGWYRYGQVKIFADGSLGGRTAALLEPYADDPATSGIYMHERDAFIEMTCRAHELGNQVGAHCIGDGAARLFIDAVSEAQRRHYRPDSRHRMIHCQIMNKDLMQQMRSNRMVADIQPVFIKSDGYWFVERVGAERARTSYAWKGLLDLGIPLCGGSDCPIEPLNIWYGIHCAVNRQDLNGYPAGGWGPDQRLTVAQTLAMYTVGAAYSTFEEGFKGSLQPGYAADLVVPDRNPFTCDPSELKDIRVGLTVVGGKVAFEA